VTTDPLGDFFREINHRIDLYPDVAPAGDIWPTISTHDLYNVWIRDSHLRRENVLLKERCRLLHMELAKATEVEPATLPTPEEWERLRAFAPGLVELIESVRPVGACDRVVPMEVAPAGEPAEATPTKCGTHRIDGLGTTFTCECDPAHDGPHRQPTTTARFGHEWVDENCGATAGSPPLAHFTCALPVDHGGPYHAAASAPGEKYCWTDTQPKEPTS
jgi:hypothetical protein